MISRGVTPLDRTGDNIGIGIIGCGKMGRVYLHWFSKNPYCGILGVFNRTRDVAERCAGEYGARAYADWRELLESPEVEAVGLCGPSFLHYEQAIIAARHGKHILCEKPMANTMEECRQMTRIAAESGVRLMVGFQMRFHPVIEKIDQVVGAVGQIFHIDFTFPMFREGVAWRHHAEQGGGVFKEHGCHLVDLVRHWLGEVRTVTSETMIVVPGRQVEDHCVTVLRMESGATASIYTTYNDRREPAIFGLILGTHGQIEFVLSPYRPGLSSVKLMADGVTEFKIPIPEDPDPIYPGHLDSFRKEINHFVDAIKSGVPLIVDGTNGGKAIEVVIAAYESQRTGTKVSLPLNYDIPGPMNGWFETLPGR